MDDMPSSPPIDHALFLPIWTAAPGNDQYSPRPIVPRSQGLGRRPAKITNGTRSNPAPAQTTAPVPPSSTLDLPGTTKRYTVSCVCADRGTFQTGEYFECDFCGALQHDACTHGDTRPIQPPRAIRSSYPLCLPCRRTTYTALLTHRRTALVQAHTQLRAFRARLASAKTERDLRLHYLCNTHLWSHYCHLPRGQASEDLAELTSTRFDHHLSRPIHSAPSEWAPALSRDIHRLIHGAGYEMVALFAGTDGAGLEWKRPEAVLQALRDLAAFAVCEGGPFEGRVGELGVLAEVLGLREKGTFWRSVESEEGLEDGDE